MPNYTDKPSQRIKIKQLTLDGRLVRFWSSMSEASRNGYNRSNISLVVHGYRYKHKGYKWERA